MGEMITFDTYADLVSAGLKGQRFNVHWFDWLTLKGRREEAEKDILKINRRKHPGLTDNEILSRFSGVLDREFSVPSFPWSVEE